MKNVLFILVVLMISCRAPKQGSPVPLTTRTEIKERPVDIPAIQDSSSIKALFACDSNNRVVLKNYNALYSQYMSLATEFVPVGDELQVTIATHTNHPSTTAMVTDSLIYKEVPVYIKGDTIEVEKPLTWFQKTLIYSGSAAWIILLLFIITRFPNPLKLIK